MPLLQTQPQHMNLSNTNISLESLLCNTDAYLWPPPKRFPTSSIGYIYLWYN